MRCDAPSWAWIFKWHMAWTGCFLSVKSWEQPPICKSFLVQGHVLHDILTHALIDASAEGWNLFRELLTQRWTHNSSLGLSSMESKAPEIPSSGLYWEQSNGLRHLLYFILLYPFEVSKPNKKLLLRFTREGNSRTKENHSPSSLNWARYRKEGESVTALREQGMGAKSIKRRKAQVQLPPLSSLGVPHAHINGIWGCRCP